MGVDQHLQWQQLLNQLPEDLAPEAWKEILGPTVAGNPEQQQRFYELFDQSLEQVQALHTEVEEQKAEEQKRRRHLIWSIPLLVLLLAGLGYWYWPQAPIPTDAEVPEEVTSLPDQVFVVAPNSTERFCLSQEIIDSLGGISSSSICPLYPEPDTLGQLALDTAIPQCLSYTAKSQIGADTFCLMLFNAANTFGRTLRVIALIENPVVQEEAAPIEVPTVSTLFPPKVSPVSQPLESLKPTALNDFQKAMQQYGLWIRLAAIALLGGLLWLLLQWRERKRRKLIAEQDENQKPPYVWNIKIDNLDPIRLNDTFNQTLQRLRTRVTDDYFRLDIPQTIQATIEKAGMTDFRYRQQTRPPEYLMLIDRHSAANHRARLYDYLYQMLLENEVHVERFFYRGDLKVLWNEKHPHGITLKTIQNRYTDARLLIMGTGYHLLSPSGKLAGWTSLFSQWKERAVLTPEPLSSWGQRERQIEESFLLMPATLQGFNYLIEQLDAGEDADPNSWRNKITDAQTEAIHMKDGLIQSLKAQYPRHLFNWIAACAVYPSLHWDLTRLIGQELSTPEEPLVTLDNLAELNRLSWFVEGKMTLATRALFREYLEQEEPQVLLHVQKALHALLQHNKPPRDSAAWQEHEMTVAFNEWLFTKDAERKKALEKQIASLIEAGVDPDFTVIKHLNRERTPLDFVVPDSWKKHLHQQGYTALGLKEFWKDALYWALPIWAVFSAFFAFWPVDTQTCRGTVEQYTKDDGTVLEICLDSLNDQILLIEHLDRRALSDGAYEAADSIMSEAILSLLLYAGTGDRRGETSIDDLTIQKISNLPMASFYISDYEVSMRKTLYDIYAKSMLLSDLEKFDFPALNTYRKHLSVDYYNLGAALYAEMEQYPEGDTVYNALRDSLCLFFGKAYALDSTDAQIRLGYEWCQNPVAEIITIGTRVVDKATQRPLGNVLVQLSDGRSTSTASDGTFSFSLLDSLVAGLRLQFVATGYEAYAYTISDASAALPLIELTPIRPQPENQAIIVNRDTFKFGDYLFFQNARNENQFYYGPNVKEAYYPNGQPKMVFIRGFDFCDVSNAASTNDVLYRIIYDIGDQNRSFKAALKGLLAEFPNSEVLGPISERLEFNIPLAMSRANYDELNLQEQEYLIGSESIDFEDYDDNFSKEWDTNEFSRDTFFIVGQDSFFFADQPSISVSYQYRSFLEFGGPVLSAVTRVFDSRLAPDSLLCVLENQVYAALQADTATEAQLYELFERRRIQAGVELAAFAETSSNTTRSCFYTNYTRGERELKAAAYDKAIEAFLQTRSCALLSQQERKSLDWSIDFATRQWAEALQQAKEEADQSEAERWSRNRSYLALLEAKMSELRYDLYDLEKDVSLLNSRRFKAELEVIRYKTVELTRLTNDLYLNAEDLPSIRTLMEEARAELDAIQYLCIDLRRKTLLTNAAKDDIEAAQARTATLLERWREVEADLDAAFRRSQQGGAQAYEEKGRFGFKDADGKILVPAQYEEVRPFKGGIAPVKRDALWGFVDTSGTEVISPQFSSPGIPKPQMVLVQGGKFQMGDQFGEGDEDELPLHEVQLNSYYMATTETTFAAYDLFCAATGRALPDDEGWGRAQRPAIYVSWYDAIEYTNWLSVQHDLEPVYSINKEQQDPTNQSTLDDLKWTVRPNWSANGYRLPSEAEWEYAAKGGAVETENYRYSGSNEINEVAWYSGNSDSQTQLVGAKKANALGLYDMSGNVYEWCWDWYASDYYQSNAASGQNPKGPDRGSSRLVRGGSWNFNPNYCRATIRNWLIPVNRSYIIGFRVVRHP